MPDAAQEKAFVDKLLDAARAADRGEQHPPAPKLHGIAATGAGAAAPPAPDFRACDVLDEDFTQGQADCFVNALSISLVPSELRQKSRRIAVVRDPFIYVKRRKKEQFAILTPPGYETDFASIPPAVQWLIAPFGKHAEAAVVHDWLYSIGEKDNEAERKDADTIFLEALSYLKVDPIRRLLMFIAVRFGGKKAFGRKGEYNNRFRDLATLKRLNPPPFSKRVMREYALCKRTNAPS